MDYNIIKKIAENKQMTMREVCIKANVTEPGYYKMIKKGSMRVDVLENLAKALDVDISSFFNNTIIPNVVFENDNEYKRTCKNCEQHKLTIQNQHLLINRLIHDLEECEKRLNKKERKAG